MHGQSKSGLGAFQVSRREPGLHEAALQQLAAAAAAIDEQRRIDAQHELDQAMIEQRRPHLERVRHAGPVDLREQPFGEGGMQIEPAQLHQRSFALAPELPVEPQIIVAALAPIAGEQLIDLHLRHAAECGRECR